MWPSLKQVHHFANSDTLAEEKIRITITHNFKQLRVRNLCEMNKEIVSLALKESLREAISFICLYIVQIQEAYRKNFGMNKELILCEDILEDLGSQLFYYVEELPSFQDTKEGKEKWQKVFEKKNKCWKIYQLLLSPNRIFIPSFKLPPQQIPFSICPFEPKDYIQTFQKSINEIEAFMLGFTEILNGSAAYILKKNKQKRKTIGKGKDVEEQTLLKKTVDGDEEMELRRINQNLSSIEEPILIIWENTQNFAEFCFFVLKEQTIFPTKFGLSFLPGFFLQISFWKRISIIQNIVSADIRLIMEELIVSPSPFKNFQQNIQQKFIELLKPKLNIPFRFLYKFWFKNEYESCSYALKKYLSLNN